MNDTIADWIALGVEVLITSVIVSGLVFILTASQQINIGIVEQQALSAEMQEYRIHNEYDHTHVYQQDIISAIFKGRGSPSVAVTSSKGSYSWTLTRADSAYTTAELAKKIDPTVIYNADLVKGPNGEIIGYTFKNCTGGCGR